MTSTERREMINITTESSLVYLVNKDEMKHIYSKIKSDCANFNENFNDIEKSIISYRVNI